MFRTPRHVAILMATRNGAAFLPDQLRSLNHQSHKAWHLILSDDGSVDSTCDIAKALVPAQRLRILKGPEAGVALNFWNALSHVPDGHYASFCDQDDVWCIDKLERAIRMIGDVTGPALYSAGRYVTDSALAPRFTQQRKPTRGFTQALLRNRVAGHTCVLSPDAVRLLKRFPPGVTVPFHDWWAAVVLSASSARFVHDPNPVLFYRQHRDNLFGAQGGRIRALMNGSYLAWVQANMLSLAQYEDQLSDGARRALRICHAPFPGLSLKRL